LIVDIARLFGKLDVIFAADRLSIVPLLPPLFLGNIECWLMDVGYWYDSFSWRRHTTTTRLRSDHPMDCMHFLLLAGSHLSTLRHGRRHCDYMLLLLLLELPQPCPHD
jgi:hypothetical protein